MSHQFHPSILREYDVRGIVGTTLTEQDAYALGRSFAALATSEGVRSVAVGRDGRSRDRPPMPPQRIHDRKQAFGLVHQASPSCLFEQDSPQMAAQKSCLRGALAQPISISHQWL